MKKFYYQKNKIFFFFTIQKIVCIVECIYTYISLIISQRALRFSPVESGSS